MSGLKVAFPAFLISLVFYLSGLPVTPVTMAAAGLLAWLILALLPLLLRRADREWRQAIWGFAACVATCAVVGGMY